MLRLSRSQVIGDIEYIVHRASPTFGKKEWSASDAGCLNERLSFTGETFSFQIHILQVRFPATGSPKWKLVIVNESWQNGDGEALHASKWLKLLSGKPADVLTWVRMARSSK